MNEKKDLMREGLRKMLLEVRAFKCRKCPAASGCSKLNEAITSIRRANEEKLLKLADSVDTSVSVLLRGPLKELDSDQFYAVVNSKYYTAEDFHIGADATHVESRDVDYIIDDVVETSDEFGNLAFGIVLSVKKECHMEEMEVHIPEPIQDMLSRFSGRPSPGIEGLLGGIIGSMFQKDDDD